MLFTCRPGYGHYYPLLPLARAAAAAGHAVAFATGEPIREMAEADGFEAFTAGPDSAAIRAAIVAAYGPLEKIPREQHRQFFFGRVFTGIELPARLPELLAITDKWRPDLIVHELSEFAGPLTAEIAGLPHVTCGFGPLPEPEVADVAAAAAAEHYVAAGLPPAAARLYRSVYLDPCPPALQVPAASQLTRRIAVRPELTGAGGLAGSGSSGLAGPGWLRSLPRQPTVHVTLGTVWNQDLSFFRIVLGSLAGRPLNVVAALGPGRDPAELGPQPPNVVVGGFIPHAQLLGHCDLVICHGGAGSVLDALAVGLPLLIVPQAADNFYNARRVVAAGAGRTMQHADVTAAAVGREVDLLLSRTTYRDKAAAIAAEIAAMPPARDALAGLAALVAEAGPNGAARS
jgi:UDP:flavonoid glycosyltransferase YjiC (YdhE family)